jgi:D-lactate dehydrogenase (cytochrome)
VRALTVVLPDGDVLEIERGDVCAGPGGFFELELSDRTARVPVPTYRMPRTPKLAAGYYAAPDMDLVDLFIGSEGTLGVVTSVTLRVLPERAAVCLALVPFRSWRDALAVAGTLRQMAMTTWRTGDRRGVDISGIEHLDRRCLTLLRDEGADRRNGVAFPPETAMALLVALELPPGTRPEDAFDQIGRAGDPEPPDTPLVRFCRLLAGAGVLGDVEVAVPGDLARAAQLMAVREAVPTAVNRRIGQGKLDDPRIEKTAGDIVVPFERVEEMLVFCTAEFRRRDLDAAVWGHLSDGNLHPNVLPRSYADVESGRAAMLAIGREAMRLGGAPLAEHGVGRNKVKQRLLNELYGDAGVEEMRRVKRAIDPRWKLAPGVLFARAMS